MLDLRTDTCGYLFSTGYAWASDIGNGDPDAAEYAYDTLQLFLEHCPFYDDTENGPDVSWGAFDIINGPAAAIAGSDSTKWASFLSFLKSVLYSNPDTPWYCEDVNSMLAAVIHSQGIAAQQAVLQYIYENHRCPLWDSLWQIQFRHDMASRLTEWFDSAKNRWWYLNSGPLAGKKAYEDSLKADTLAHPFDSTVPSLEQVDLQILLGPQYAVSGPSTPVTSQALISAQLLDNPVSNEIGVKFQMGREALITMQLQDVLGRNIPIQYGKYQLTPAGSHTAYIPDPNLPPGTYYLRISTDVGDVITLKVVKQ